MNEMMGSGSERDGANRRRKASGQKAEKRFGVEREDDGCQRGFSAYKKEGTDEQDGRDSLRLKKRKEQKVLTRSGWRGWVVHVLAAKMAGLPEVGVWVYVSRGTRV
jgi:hypothetical protein